MWALLVVLVAVGIFIYGRVINKLKGLPPGPPPLPLLGNFLNFEVDMDEKFLAWKKRYGKIFTVWLPDPVIVIADHKVLQETIVKEGDAYADRRIPPKMMKMLLGGNYGLVLEDNHMWKEQRRFALHALRDVGFSSSALQNTIHLQAHEIIEDLKKKDGQKLNIHVHIMSAVANVVWQLIFGKTLPMNDPLFPSIIDKFKKFLVLFTHPIILLLDILPGVEYFDPLSGGALKKLQKVNDELLDILDQQIEEVEKTLDMDEPSKCFVDGFLKEMKKREQAGEPGNFTRQQLRMAANDIWGAGFETTVTTLRWAILYLINNPKIQEKMYEEIQAKVGDREITAEDQKQLNYCCAVVQETQRIKDILTLNIFRQVARTTVMEGYTLPEGTGVLPQFQIIHKDPEEFERPHYFCPERHINEKGEFVKDPRITPFSVGKRSCLGEGLARLELFLILTSLVQHIRFESPSVIPPTLEPDLGFTRSPRPYEVIVHNRSSA